MEEMERTELKEKFSGGWGRDFLILFGGRVRKRNQTRRYLSDSSKSKPVLK